MAAVCHRCALRLQRIAQADAAVFRKRTFSSTSTLHRLPTFADSSNPELNEALTQLRDKHLVPAYLGKQQRKLIFGQKYKQFLQDNPQTAYPGGQEVELRWIDRKRDIPKRRPLVSKALHLIMDSESNDWQNLPLVLEGMKEGVKKPLREQDLEMLVRKALQRGKLGVIIQCLQQSEKTGMSLEQEYVLRSVVYGLREMAFRSGWDRATTAKALRDANVISLLLESEEHGSGRKLKPDDPRVRPEILGVFLELAAVYAKKHSGSKDGQGLVKAYAGRLVSSLAARNAEAPSISLHERKQQWPMLFAISVWHGLSVAQQVLDEAGQALPQAAVASQAIASYDALLKQLVDELEARHPRPDTYDEQALSAYKAALLA